MVMLFKFEKFYPSLKNIIYDVSSTILAPETPNFQTSHHYKIKSHTCESSHNNNNI